MMHLSLKSLAEYLDVSPHTVRRLVEAGTLPEPVYIGPKLPRWDRQRVDDALAKKAPYVTTSRVDPDQLVEEAVNAIAQRRSRRKGRR